jgi:hypothetical protein
LALVDESKQVLATRKISPEELRSIHARQEQNGWLGEEIVYNHEREVLDLVGHSNLSRLVKWVSRSSVGEGYDIESFDPLTGEPRYIEVKSCEGALKTFEVTANEWKKAALLGSNYFVYCVSNVRRGAAVHILRDPCRLEQDGGLRRDASSWRVHVSAGRRYSCHAELDSWPLAR